MTASPADPATVPRASAPLPSPLRIALARAAVETKVLFRERDAVVFTFALPIVFLVLFASIFFFSDSAEGTGVTVAQLYTAGLIGSGVMGTGFQNLGIGIAGDREDGTLKRLVGLPMPRAAYFIGKIASVLVMTVLQVAILLAIAVLFYDLTLPAEVSTWLTFAWVFVLGVSAASVLGIAVSGLPRSGKSATAVISLPFVVLQFVSGVFIPITQLPDWLVNAASIFPLKWMCQGFRAVFLGDAGAALELTGSYELGRVALVLAAWLVGGLVLCVTTFRWKGRRDG
ncbi:ABC transporter permease [Microbispora sp. H10836]|uniref:ABC transporter permease n=1 Tax=Microbispora sp. H10836 TaxID=2729106 RepID=UPI0014750EBD|nr:ABC transporter permease [Microbispora sp. H10836]